MTRLNWPVIVAWTVGPLLSGVVWGSVIALAVIAWRML